MADKLRVAEEEESRYRQAEANELNQWKGVLRGLLTSALVAHVGIFFHMYGEREPPRVKKTVHARANEITDEFLKSMDEGVLYMLTL